MINANTKDDSPLVRLSNAYLVDPEKGQLTLGTASVWVDQDSGKIVHIAFDDNDGDSNDDSRSLTAFYVRNNAFSEAQQHKLNTCPVVDLDQAILSPGLIDIQINGCFGVDFSDWAPNDALGRTAEEAYLDGLEKAARNLACTGVTSFLPTVISQTAESYKEVIPAIQTAYKRAYPSILGYHLEGPFLSGKKPGCHPPENLRCAEEGWNTMLEMYGNGPMGVDETSENDQKINQMAKIVTVAPELMGGTQTINKLKHAGFVVSIGHSAATTAQAVDAVDQGASLITHLFNAMPHLHHREPGVIGLLGLNQAAASGPGRIATHISQMVHSNKATPRRSKPDEEPPFPSKSSPLVETSPSESSRPVSPTIQQEERTRSALMNLQIDQFGAQTTTKSTQSRRPFWSIIADGVHVHPMAVNFAYQAHTDGCVLITDAVSLMDPALPDGHYPWRSHTIEKWLNSITLSGTDTLAGAAVSLDECVRNLSLFCSIPLSRAIHHATRVPAKVLGPKVESRKGALRVGWDADLCVWDRFSGKVLSTWRGGKQVYGDLSPAQNCGDSM